MTLTGCGYFTGLCWTKTTQKDYLIEDLKALDNVTHTGCAPGCCCLESSLELAFARDGKYVAGWSQTGWLCQVSIMALAKS